MKPKWVAKQRGVWETETGGWGTFEIRSSRKRPTKYYVFRVNWLDNVLLNSF